MQVTVRKPSEAEAVQAPTWAVWECQPSSFEWGYSEEEECLFIEGEAMVQAMGKEYKLGPGDYAVFPKGLFCRWNVTKAVKKYYRFNP
jgi:uncharacterized cupin superfamily protein